MRDYSSYLFDFDGTLTATLPYWHSAIRQALLQLDPPLTDAHLAIQLLGGWSTAATDSLQHLGIVDSTIFSDTVNNIIATVGLHEALLHTGAVDTLQAMKAKGQYRALVTNNFQENVQRSFDHHNLHGLFNLVVTREMVTKVKPDPEMVLLALGENPAGDAVMVGDSAHDIAAAHAAGVSAYLYFPVENEQYYSYDYVKSFGADRIIRDFEELLLT